MDILDNNSQGESLSRRKRFYYVALLVFQILVVFWPMMTVELIVQGRTSMNFDTMGMIENVLVLVLIIVNILFLKQFVGNKWVFLVICLIYAVSFIVSTVAHISPTIRADASLLRKMNLFSFFTIFWCLCYTFYVAVKDIFRYKHDLVYSLVGAANIFLLIGSIFGFIINIVGSVFPGMVVPVDQVMVLDTHSNTLAYYTLASIDLPFDNVNPFIRNILVIESIFSHLFVVMIIGRLLSK